MVLLAALAAAVSAGVWPGSPRIGPPRRSSKKSLLGQLSKDGESDAELFVSGIWSASLIGSLSFQSLGMGEILSSSSATPVLFTQDPDVFLSFILFKKIFVEAKVSRQHRGSALRCRIPRDDDETLK
jgi:hypothetical protein